MRISYNWLREYLPEADNNILSPEKLSNILTSIGLEVEGIEKYEEIRGGLKGLVAGEVISCEKHPEADRLKLTSVLIGNDTRLQIVCGANNIAAGQKVVVAQVDTDIFPTAGGTISIKKTHIRGIESQGMICSEDEIGIGMDHSGIIILPADTKPGTPVSEIFTPYDDTIFEIGLTPNRIDAMSHIGVAKDVCAYMAHHHKSEYQTVLPYKNSFTPDKKGSPITVRVESEACKRYSGISIDNIKVTASPQWLTQKLRSIGVKPINNIVDITNFILHETGQPLHAFDADKISKGTIVVKTLASGTSFTTLDDKQRKLNKDDLMICDADSPLCIAGVYGGLNSGVSEQTKNIFLESAWFEPSSVRRTSLAHGLRTDAATRFEKGTDISNTVNVLKRAALLIKEIAGGDIHGEITDVYPQPKQKNITGIKYHYLKKISGKNYHGDTIKNILKSLGFEILKDATDELTVNVPFSKPDVLLPADIAEEIMRIDGLDNIEIPGTISIAPSVERNAANTAFKEKIASYLTSSGFFEIFTNSISNSKLYTETTLQSSVKMINSLSSELDILRPEMLQSGLQAIEYNLNRKNSNIRFYEFGKTYHADGNKYNETAHLSLYVSGNVNESDWKNKSPKSDVFFLKGLISQILDLAGIKEHEFLPAENDKVRHALKINVNKQTIGICGEVSNETLKQHDIKQPVYYADIEWTALLSALTVNSSYKEISKFPAAERDLAMVLDKNVPFAAIKQATNKADVKEITSIQLFDVFESDKLGTGKKSVAINYIFSDDTRTLTDNDIDAMMNKLIRSYEKELKAEIRNR